MADRPRGRPRDPHIDTAVLAQARRLLALGGYERLSIAEVARRAGTTRQAVYRRWPSKADLATAAIADMSEAAERPPTGDPYADLVAELEAFRRGISRPNGVALAAGMLQPRTDRALVRRYRERIVAPRRARLRAILERARDAGLLDAGGDVELAVSTFTGSWYALSLAGEPPPEDWAPRLATLAWRALGGVPTR